MMAESKKRSADTGGSAQIKKPKFGKKPFSKGSAEKKGNNPFQKYGKFEIRFLLLRETFIFSFLH